jgi:LL-H family phage holin
LDDLIFEFVKIVVMVVALLISVYLIPWIKSKLSADKISEIAFWVEKAVLYAQQVFNSSTGTEKKAIVTEFLKAQLEAKDISISDEQINILIEAAVKQMKIEENAASKTE